MDIFDMTIEPGDDSADSRRPCPDGKFLAIVTSVEKAENPNNGNQGLEIKLALREALGGQDMTGVNIERVPVKNTVWVTERSRNVARDRVFYNIMPEERGKALNVKQFAEDAIGRSVIVNLQATTEDRQGNPLKFPRLDVTSYEPAS